MQFQLVQNHTALWCILFFTLYILLGCICATKEDSTIEREFSISFHEAHWFFFNLMLHIFLAKNIKIKLISWRWRILFTYQVVSMYGSSLLQQWGQEWAAEWRKLYRQLLWIVDGILHLSSTSKSIVRLF